MKIAFAQIAELSWPHRQREQFVMMDGVLVPKTMSKRETGTEFVYLPLAVGALQAYVQQHAADASRFEFLPPVYKRIPVADAVEALCGADLVGMSLYVWNERLSLRVATELKARNPDVTIVVGGPQVPDDPTAFLAEHPQIDLTVHGEGEQAFLHLLEAFDARHWAAVPSLGYRRPDGSVAVNPRAPRMRDLAAAPSPYTTDVFAGLIEAHPGVKWLAMWETNRGCPFSCTFCDWGSAVGAKVSRFAEDRLEQEIAWFVRNQISHIFICDANFGLLPRDVEIAEKLVSAFEQAGLPVAISIQNSKNASERSFRIQQIFARSKLVHFGATLSLQSISTPTLKAIKRDNISLDAFHDLHVRFREAGVETYTDLIVGLPGETYDSFVDGLDEIMAKGQHNRIAFYNCSILPNAEMAAPAYRAEHAIESAPVPIVHEHEGLERIDRAEATELLHTVISTRTMGREDWVRTRVYAWMVDAFHFNRLLQIVAATLHAEYGLRYREIYETLAAADRQHHPLLADVREWLVDRASRIQAGEAEFIPSERWLNIWWPPDQFVVVNLVGTYQLDAFYDQAQSALQKLLSDNGITETGLLADAISLNKGMFRIPREFEDLEIDTGSAVLEFAMAELSGSPMRLDRRPARYRVDRSSTVWIDRNAWCEDVIVQYYRRADFLYPIVRVDPALAEATPGVTAPVAQAPAPIWLA